VVLRQRDARTNRQFSFNGPRQVSISAEERNQARELLRTCCVLFTAATVSRLIKFVRRSGGTRSWKAPRGAYLANENQAPLWIGQYKLSFGGGRPGCPLPTALSSQELAGRVRPRCRNDFCRESVTAECHHAAGPGPSRNRQHFERSRDWVSRHFYIQQPGDGPAPVV